MKLRQLAAVAIALAFVTGAALADYLVRDGNGNIITIKSTNSSGGAVLPQSVPSDGNGNPLFTGINPAVVVPAATASGDALPLTNLGIAALGLYNGTTIDRARAASGDALAATGVQAKNSVLWNGASFDRQRAAAGTTGVPAVDGESVKTTCFAAFSFAPASSPTDVLVIQGSSTKTIRIRRILWSAYGTAGVAQLSGIRRSAADTGGTPVSITVARADPNDAACTGAVSNYTANPGGLGTAVATLFNTAYGINAVSSGAQDRFVTTFGDHGGKAVVLRGTSDFLALNLNGAGAFTNAYGVIEFTEE